MKVGGGRSATVLEWAAAFAIGSRLWVGVTAIIPPAMMPSFLRRGPLP